MKDILISEIKNFRHERKFDITHLDKVEVESILRLHPAIFREIYHTRFVNNIYFDSHEKQHYFENINGVSRRLKVRIRWYNDLFGYIDKPVLELKVKHNLHVGKLSYPLHPFTLDSTLNIKSIREILNKSALPEAIKHHIVDLEFSLLNHYERKYFLSADRKYRVTLDSGMKAYWLSSFSNTFLQENIDYSGITVELKYTEQGDEGADKITRYFPFRMTRSSKYVKGIEKLAL